MAVLFIGMANEWLGVTGVAATEYCEALRSRLIRQPANSWSNLGFIAVGWVIAFQAIRRVPGETSGTFERGVFYPVFFSFLAVSLGIGSFAYHASTTRFGWILDSGSMYLLSVFMLVYAVTRLWRLRPAVFLLLYAAGLWFSFASNSSPLMFPGDIDAGSAVFGLFLVLAVALECFIMRSARRTLNGKWVVAFALTFVLSVFIWSRSRTGGAWCDPSSLLQGHAIWHLLDALCIYFIYRYYRSERIHGAAG